MARFEGFVRTPKYGRAPEFTETAIDTDYALDIVNRFQNTAGGLEKRAGMVSAFPRYTASAGDTVGPKIDGLHEFITSRGSSTTFISDTSGHVVQVSGSTFTTLTDNTGNEEPFIAGKGPVRSVQFGDRLIFYNGKDRPVYYQSGRATGTVSFKQNAIIEKTLIAGGTTSASSVDSSAISSWELTNINVNDVVFNQTLGGYGLITAVASGFITHTAISSTATGLGQAAGNQKAGDDFEVQDLIELNIVPQSGTIPLDNVAVAASGTNATILRLNDQDGNKFDLESAGMLPGDFVRNTTRGAVAMVSSVAGSNATITSVAGQAASDSVVLLKPALPTPSVVHVHRNRAYYVDSRDQQRIIISAPWDSEDVTTNTQTIDSASFLFGAQQSESERIISMSTYQRFLVIGGNRNTYLFEGQNPIQDTTADSIDFNLVGLFPQGVISHGAVISLGNDALFWSPEGIQSARLSFDSSTLGRSNLSEPIKSEMRALVSGVAMKPSEQNLTFLLHHPRRNWLMAHTSGRFDIFNYTPQLAVDRSRERIALESREGGWSRFTGKSTKQLVYRQFADGRLIAGGSSGRTWEIDVSGVYTDDGETYPTSWRVPPNTLSPGTTRNSRQKFGHYIRPVFESRANVTYEITASAGLHGKQNAISTASVATTVSASTKQIVDDKLPFRWRGRDVTVEIATSGSTGPETISNFTLYGQITGVR